MHRLGRMGLAALAVGALALFGSDTARGQAFDLSLDGPQGLVEGGAGGTADLDYDIVMTPSGDLGGNGAQGWSLSLAGDGCATITDITDQGTVAADVNDEPPGLRNTGFSVNEVTENSGEDSDCAGRAGAVQAIVLSFTMPITLPDADPSVIGKIQVSAAIPEEGDPVEGSVDFVNGCQGSGQPVNNNVTWQGETVAPTFNSAEILCGISEDCPQDGPLNLIVSTDNVFQVPEVAAGIVSDGNDEDGIIEDGVLNVPLGTGATGAVTLFAAVSSNLAGGGVQGCSVSVGVSGDLNLLGISVLGTAAGDVNDDPPGLRNTGFSVAELVNPDLEPEGGPLAGQGPQGQGAVSALVLSFTMPITLDPIGTASILSLDLESAGPQGAEPQDGRVEWIDGLQGSGQPVLNVATVEGNTVQFGCCQAVNVSFIEQPDVRMPFLRGDANNDDRLDIADSIWTINRLFRDGPDFDCPDAADFDNNGIIDVSDARAGVLYQFNGGESPPAPWPDCGIDEEDAEDGSSSDDAGICTTPTAACS